MASLWIISVLSARTKTMSGKRPSISVILTAVRDPNTLYRVRGRRRSWSALVKQPRQKSIRGGIVQPYGVSSLLGTSSESMSCEYSSHVAKSIGPSETLRLAFYFVEGRKDFPFFHRRMPPQWASASSENNLKTIVAHTGPERERWTAGREKRFPRRTIPYNSMKQEIAQHG